MQILLAILMAIAGWTGIVTISDADTPEEMARGDRLLVVAGVLLAAIVIMHFA